MKNECKLIPLPFPEFPNFLLLLYLPADPKMIKIDTNGRAPAIIDIPAPALKNL